MTTTTKSQTKSQEVAADVAALLRARNPLLWIVTREEQRVEKYLFEAASAAGYLARAWDVAAGVTGIDGRPISSFASTVGDPDGALDVIRDRSGERGLWIMRDLPVWLQPPMGATTMRRLRNLARTLPSQPRDDAQAIVVISPNGEVPAELANHATVIEWPLPDREEVAALLDATVESLPEDLRKDAVNGSRDAVIDAAVGLSGEEAQATFARSLVQLRKVDPAIIASEKRRVIAREKVLEWFDPLPGGLEAVGGLDNLKSWLVSRASAYSPAARSYGLPAPKGALLVGVPGCLAEGTLVPYLRGKRKSAAGRALPIEVLWAKFNGEVSMAGLGRAGAGKRWNPETPTYIQSWDSETGALVYNTVEKVTATGVKACLRISTDSAGVVELTADHPVLTGEGAYREACELQPGDKLLVRGSMKPQASGRKRVYRKRIVIEGLKYHPVAWRKVVVDNGKRYEYGRITRARLVVEAAMNTLDYDEFIAVLKTDAQRASTLEYLPAEYDVHHADDDPQNDDLGNLVVMTHADHGKHHGMVGNFNVEHTRTATVTGVQAIGERRTFDITVAEPRANFVVNDGIVAHNCGKSLTAKAIATAWGVPLLRLDLGALKSKYVGESEGNLRKALGVIEAIGRCVVWLDEIEKALDGASSGSADGGVSADALGAILSWMQDRQGEAFVIATANNAEKLPPELLRKGRFDEVWWVDLPTDAERAAITAAALRSYGRDAEAIGVDLDAVAEATNSFTGAELAALVPDALFSAFNEDAREITTDDLLQAAKVVVPLAKTADDKIRRLREFWLGRARPATSGHIPTGKAEASVRALDL